MQILIFFFFVDAKYQNVNTIVQLSVTSLHGLRKPFRLKKTMNPISVNDISPWPIPLLLTTLSVGLVLIKMRLKIVTTGFLKLRRRLSSARYTNV